MTDDYNPLCQYITVAGLVGVGILAASFFQPELNGNSSHWKINFDSLLAILESRSKFVNLK
jgi:hypothetical protein